MIVKQGKVIIMSIYGYIGIIYLILLNIITLVAYVKEAEEPSSRISALLLILLPIFGGSLGAVIANYFCDTEFRELRWWLSKILAYLPPVMFIIQLVMLVSTFGVDNCISFLWNNAYKTAGVIGCVLLILNAISFVLVIIRKSAYYIAPSGNYLIPDLVLIPILLLGGATGGSLAKLIFNFKEDWSCNSTMEIQNFLYNAGMFIVSAIHIALFVYFFYIR